MIKIIFPLKLFSFSLETEIYRKIRIENSGIEIKERLITDGVSPEKPQVRER